MSTTLKTLTGAALAAAITLGGFTSAYAQVLQPFGEPYSNEPVVIIDEDEGLDGLANEPYSNEPVVIMDEDESLDGLKKGFWVYEDTDISFGHEWIGVAGGTLRVIGLWHNFWDIYHKGGDIEMVSFDVDIDSFRVTLDTLNTKRRCGGNIEIGEYILQVGETTVHGEPFGVKRADKKLIMGCLGEQQGHARGISYGGVLCDTWGGCLCGRFRIINHADGVIDDVEVKHDPASWLSNLGGTINKATLINQGLIINRGYIDELHMSIQPGFSGWVDNRGGHIGTLYYHCWTDPNVLPKTGTIDNVIYVDEPLY